MDDPSKNDIENYLEDLCNPVVVRLRSNLYAIKFDIMKMIPAKYILDYQKSIGKLSQGDLVVESSSGTFALALAVICKNYNLNLSLVTGPINKYVKWRLDSLGASIYQIEPKDGVGGGIQQARLDFLNKLLEDNPRSFWPKQHENPMNPSSYISYFEHNVTKFPKNIDCLVVTTGTGGSICGFSRAIRKKNDALHVIAVDTNMSVLFGLTSLHVNPLCRDSYNPILGMGADMVTPNLDHSQCDEVHWVPVSKMIQEAHSLHENYGFMLGPTCGASYAVADWYAKRNPSKNVLTVFPDSGIRYLDTVYNESWLCQYSDSLNCFEDEPKLCSNPTEVEDRWTHFGWNRRSYAEVFGYEPKPR